MSKHSKFNRDLEKLDKPSLHERRNELVREFIDASTDAGRAHELMDQLDAIEEKLIQD